MLNSARRHESQYPSQTPTSWNVQGPRRARKLAEQIATTQEVYGLGTIYTTHRKKSNMQRYTPLIEYRGETRFLEVVLNRT